MSDIYVSAIRFLDNLVTLACDGNCGKAWGINGRPKVSFDPKAPDDVAWLADDELGTAPENPGTWEGGHGKPEGPHSMNKWCARECERAKTFKSGEIVELPDYSKRLYNQPWKHNQP